jgi:hypothetical protein
MQCNNMMTVINTYQRPYSFAMSLYPKDSIRLPRASNPGTSILLPRASNPGSSILLPRASNLGPSILFSGLQTRGSLVPFSGPQSWAVYPSHGLKPEDLYPFALFLTYN